MRLLAIIVGMATTRLFSGSHIAASLRRTNRSAASLIELLVVMFIIGIMMSLLLPALQRSRAEAQRTACENNVRQLNFAMSRCSGSKRKFPEPHRWTVAILPYMEEQPLFDVMKGNYDRQAEFARPALLRCPMQEDVPSDVPGVGTSHYLLVVDRTVRGEPMSSWEIHDRPLLVDGSPQEPWHVGPEISWLTQQRLFANEPGPHPPGLYVTKRGLFPR